MRPWRRRWARRRRATRLGQLRYDLAKLRGKGLVERVAGTQSYCLPAEGYRIAVLYLKLFHRIYAPLTAGILEPVPWDDRLPPERRALLDRLYAAVDRDLNQLFESDRCQAGGLKRVAKSQRIKRLEKREQNPHFSSYNGLEQIGDCLTQDFLELTVVASIGAWRCGAIPRSRTSATPAPRPGRGRPPSGDRSRTGGSSSRAASDRASAGSSVGAATAACERHCSCTRPHCWPGPSPAVRSPPGHRRPGPLVQRLVTHHGVDQSRDRR